MPKITFKTLGLLAIFSFFAMHINGYINFVTNFLVMLSYNTRLALSFMITLILYFIATYLLAKTDGYITTGKLKFDKKAQIEGTIIGSVIYLILSFLLAFAGKNIQNIFYQFFYNGYMVYGILYCLDIIEENGLMPSYFINIGIIPFITATRIFGLFRGRQIRINETPAFESQDLETVLVEEEIKKKSWQDSIKIDE